jgi:hypothetical protein
MDERWETLQNGGRVQCNRPEIPRRIQVTQSIADENPNLVEAVALYHSGIELINESAAILFEGCRTEITLEVYLSRFRQAEGARDQFLAAEAALQRQQP